MSRLGFYRGAGSGGFRDWVCVEIGRESLLKFVRQLREKRLICLNLWNVGTFGPCVSPAQIDVNPLFNEILEDIESEYSYVFKLDEPDLLVTHLSKLNEDDCFDPGGNFILEEIEACLTSDSISLGIDDDDFDPEGDILLLEKLLNDDPSYPFPPKKLNFKELKVIKSDVYTDFEDDYYDSEGDIIYLESLLIKDTIPNLPPEPASSVEGPIIVESVDDPFGDLDDILSDYVLGPNNHFTSP
ncbi:hypothetical protein Tco_0664627 [Tanacetum coccineum]